MEENLNVTEQASAPKAKAKASKPNIFVRFGRWCKKFWKEYTSELKKVVWMPWKDIRKDFVLVVVVVIAFSAAIALIDTAFGEIIEGVAGLVG